MENKKITTLTLPVQTEKGVMNQTYDLHPLWDNIEEAPAVYDKIYEILNDKQTKDSINSSKRIRNDQEMEYALLSMASSLPNYSNKEVMFYTRYDQNPDTSISCTFPEGDWLVRFVKRASEVYITATQGDITLYRVYSEPVKNFSFEDNIFPPHWDTNNSNIVSLTGLEAQSGTYCMKISDPGGHLYSSTIIIPRPNETYGASMWIKGEALEGLNPAPVYLQLEFFDVYLNSLGRSKSAWTKEWTSDWQQIILTNIAVPANAVSMRIVASSSPAGEGCIYFDNFNLFISNQEDNNLLKEYNPDFETVVDIPGWPRINGDYRKYIEILVDDRSISLNNGNRVMKITASGVWVYSDPISLKANVSYTFSANVWGTGAALHLSEDTAILKKGVTRVQDGDTQILTYTPDSDKDIYLVITTPGSASAIVYVDNVLFAPTEDYVNKSSVEIALSEWKEISASNSVLKNGEGTDSLVPATTQGATGTGDENDPGPVASGHSAVALGRYTRAISDESMAIGYATLSGIKGYNMISVDAEALTITVNDANLEEKAREKYAIGNILQFDAAKHHYNKLKITSLSTNDSGQSVIGIESLTENVLDLSLDKEDPTKENYCWVIDKNYGEIFPMSYGSHAEGELTKAMGRVAHAEGRETQAIGGYSHAEGRSTVANYGAHSEGLSTTASGFYAHAEGQDTNASGTAAHAEGRKNTASGTYAHAEGYENTASGEFSHVEGSSNKSIGKASHAEGRCTIAASEYQHVEGKFNVQDAEDKYAHIVGGGTDNKNRKNIHTVDWDGNATYAGKLSIGILEPVEDNDVVTKSYVDFRIKDNNVAVNNYVDSRIEDNNIVVKDYIDSRCSDRSIKCYEVETDKELNYIISNINNNLDANSQEKCIINVIAHPNLYYNSMDAINSDKTPKGWLRTGQYAKGSAVINSETPKHESYFLMKRNGTEGAANSWYYVENTVDGMATTWGENISLKYSLMIDNDDMTGWTLYLPLIADGKANRPFTLTIKDYILNIGNTNIKTLVKGIWYDLKMMINNSICEFYLDGEFVYSIKIEKDPNILTYINMGIAPYGGNDDNGTNIGMNIDNVTISNNNEFTDVNPNDIQLPGGEWCFEITKTTKEYQAIGYNKLLAARYVIEDDKWLVTDVLSTLNRITSLESKPTIYSGTEEPDNFEGKDGDIYIMYEE